MTEKVILETLDLLNAARSKLMHARLRGIGARYDADQVYNRTLFHYMFATDGKGKPLYKTLTAQKTVVSLEKDVIRAENSWRDARMFLVEAQSEATRFASLLSVYLKLYVPRKSSGRRGV